MIVFNRRGAGLAALALLAGSFFLVACGDNEPEQRKAFMTFLQTRIVDRPGVHIPVANDEDIKSFGPYAAHSPYSTRYRKAKARKGLTGSFGDRSWLRKAII